MSELCRAIGEIAGVPPLGRVEPAVRRDVALYRYRIRRWFKVHEYQAPGAGLLSHLLSSTDTVFLECAERPQQDWGLPGVWMREGERIWRVEIGATLRDPSAWRNGLIYGEWTLFSDGVIPQQIQPDMLRELPLRLSEEVARRGGWAVYSYVDDREWLVGCKI